MRDSSQAARGKLCEVQQAGKKIRLKCKDLEEAKLKWQERILALMEVDQQDKNRDKALECIKRFKQVEREQEKLETRALEHQKLEAQLAEDLRVIDEKISGLRHRKLEMSVKQCSSDTSGANASEQFGTQFSKFTEIDEVFDRWEIKLARCYEASSVLQREPEDSLEEEFKSKEETLDLNLALDEMLKNQTT